MTTLMQELKKDYKGLEVIMGLETRQFFVVVFVNLKVTMGEYMPRSQSEDGTIMKFGCYLLNKINYIKSQDISQKEYH